MRTQDNEQQADTAPASDDTTAKSTAKVTVKAKVNSQFSQTAVSYRNSRVHAQGPEFANLIRAANFQGHETVVDAGCGAGHTAVHIAPHVRQVIAVDLSEAMLAQAAELCAERGIENVRFVQGDVETLDYAIQSLADAPIHAIVSRFSAHHWPQPQAALAAFRRLLAPVRGGCVYLMDVMSQDDPVYDTHLQAIELLRDPSHVRDHSISQWVRMFAQAGFHAQPIDTWDLAIDFDDWVARMQTPPLETQAIRNLFDGAPAEVQRRFNLGQASHNFTFVCATVCATLSASIQAAPDEP